MVSISIIIPTHNRCGQLQVLLAELANQDVDLNRVEVVVVADKCTDGTISMLSNHSSPFVLKYVQNDIGCAAATRNKGVEFATGDLLIFVDDDVEPSRGFISSHVALHNKPDTVAIGYLKYDLPANADFYKIKLWAWWEDKFTAMARPGYWHNFEDLLSGNFSISAELFRRSGGFNEQLNCREDYELGARLIKMNANFRFSRDAWGYHRDNATDLDRSLQRKLSEGMADVHFGRMHPDILKRLKLWKYTNKRNPLKKRLFLSVAIAIPFLTDMMARIGRFEMNIFEKLRMRRSWQKMNSRLHEYWYLRGVLQQLGSKKSMQKYFKVNKPDKTDVITLEVDLSQGINVAAQAVDLSRPDAAEVFLDHRLVCRINKWAGGERLRGDHLRAMLATNMSWRVMEALALKNLMQNQTVTSHDNYAHHIK